MNINPPLSQINSYDLIFLTSWCSISSPWFLICPFSPSPLSSGPVCHTLFCAKREKRLSLTLIFTSQAVKVLIRRSMRRPLDWTTLRELMDGRPWNSQSLNEISPANWGESNHFTWESKNVFINVIFISSFIKPLKRLNPDAAIDPTKFNALSLVSGFWT